VSSRSLVIGASTGSRQRDKNERERERERRGGGRGGVTILLVTGHTGSHKLSRRREAVARRRDEEEEEGGGGGTNDNKWFTLPAGRPVGCWRAETTSQVMRSERSASRCHDRTTEIAQLLRS